MIILVIVLVYLEKKTCGFFIGITTCKKLSFAPLHVFLKIILILRREENKKSYDPLLSPL